MPQPNEREFLQHVLRNHAPAILFCESLFRISQTLDDLLDRDRPVSQETVYNAFFEALIGLPANTFYRENEPFLRPLMAMALQDWRDSFVLERMPEYHHRSLAYVLRDQLTGLVVQCAGLIGGAQWMQQVGPEIRLHFHDETLADYMAALPGPIDAPEVMQLREQLEALQLDTAVQSSGIELPAEVDGASHELHAGLDEMNVMGEQP